MVIEYLIFIPIFQKVVCDIINLIWKLDILRLIEVKQIVGTQLSDTMS